MRVRNFPASRSQVVPGINAAWLNVKGAERFLSAFDHAAFLFAADTRFISLFIPHVFAYRTSHSTLPNQQARNFLARFVLTALCFARRKIS